MSVYEKIIQLLQDNKISYQALEHEPTPTCADSARVRGTSMDQGAKALVCYGDKKPLLIVLPCSRRIDPKLFKKLHAIRDLRFATSEEVKQLTSLEIGAIPPLGHLFNVPTFVDAALSGQQTIAFNAGDRSRSVIMDYSQYEIIAKRYAYQTQEAFSLRPDVPAAP